MLLACINETSKRLIICKSILTFVVCTVPYNNTMYNTTTTLWGIKCVAVNFLQQLLQILTDFDNFCIKLTRNE